MAQSMTTQICEPPFALEKDTHEARMTTDGKIFCAIDFGTTYSGVAFAFVGDGEAPEDVDVELIQTHWPGQSSSSSPKVPTVLKYDNSPKGFKWGFELDDDPDRICFAKLYLDPAQIEAAEELARFSKRLAKLPPNRSVKDVVSQYLGALRSVALDRMRAEWGDDFVESTPIEYILTVPAVWSDKAKADTLWCGSNAGIGAVGTIRLITEPEAAAVYTFSQLPESSMKQGDVFITCDCGGGTIDLTTYAIAATTPNLRVREITISGGGLGGSVYLNKSFEDLIRSKIGTQLNGLPKTEYLEVIDEIQKVFDDEIKPDFGVTETQKTYYVPVPSCIASRGDVVVTDGKLQVTTAELRHHVFDKVIKAILNYLTEQVDRVGNSPGSPEVSAIFLVGGFGSSAYLRRSIQGHFDGDALPKVNVIQPPDAWSAVTRGAMLRGIQRDIVETRLIRAFYGINHKTQWNPAVHETPERWKIAEGRKSYSEIEGKYFCENIMTWYVKKGDSFSKSKAVKFSFYRAVRNLENLVFHDNLVTYAGKDDDAPYFHDESCKIVATLKSDLSSIDKNRFQRVYGKSGSYYNISYDVELTFEAMISFRLLFEGEVCGQMDIDFARA